jgi:hypothetical protein
VNHRRGRADAVRHFRWQADMAVHRFIGTAFAEQFGNAHERTNFEAAGGFSYTHPEMVMDIINNKAGRNFIRDRGGRGVSENEWILVAIAQLNAGKMVIIHPDSFLLIPSHKRGIYRWDVLGLP